MKNRDSNQEISIGVWKNLLQCYKFLNRDIGTKMRRDYNQSLSRFEILEALSQIEDDWLPVGQLAKQLPDPSGNISGLLDRMEKEGIIVRQLSPDDRRSFQVGLTEDGKQLYKKMVWDYNTWIASAMEEISTEERTVLMSLLERMIQTFDHGGKQHPSSG